MRRYILVTLLAGLGLFALGLWLRQPKAEKTFSGLIVGGEQQAEGFARAEGPRSFEFPLDFGPHPEFQTEWWYYTGNLEDEEGRHFGYQLTFFQRALAAESDTEARSSAWASEHIYMAHFALTDTEGGNFHAFERFSRGAAGLAGASAEPYSVWLENWRVEQIGSDRFALSVASSGLELQLELWDEEGPVLQGNAGYSRKGSEEGNASYYYSQTRLRSEGQVRIDGVTYTVSGLSWKDHEFSTSALSEGQVGWDWFSIQLSDESELMLYQLRRADGSIDPFSAGTLFRTDGSQVALSAEDFTIESNASWRSPHSGADYPMGWDIRIPAEGIGLRLSPRLQDQELNLSFIYWEGAVSVKGEVGGDAVQGEGYVEMTGYAASMEGQF